MEWVETTGRSVQEAKEAALDELGVDEADAEFEVLAEAQTGLFGRLRAEARVRARVRPTAPRAKEDRRDRRRRGGRSGSGDTPAAKVPAGTTAAESSDAGSNEAGDAEAGSVDPVSAGRPGRPASAGGAAGGDGATTGTSGPRRNNRGRGKRPGGGGPTDSAGAARSRPGDHDSTNGGHDLDTAKGPQVEVALEQQAEVAVDFLTKLTAEFGLEASVNVARPDDETVELQLSGSDLGILIGPKGATLLAVQSLTRTVVFNETGANNGHINVDVGGYRQKRNEALARFATQVADRVKQSGSRTVLEPMSSLDRKIVHDTIGAIDGVTTVSEGEEPRRRVVVLPG